MDHVRQHTEANRVTWNSIAPSRPPEPPEFFAGGGSTLDDCEAEALGPVTGRRLLHLQCAAGNDSLSWAVRGAQVVGVDISDVAIATATRQAATSGLDATFVAADVYDLPESIGTFDIVYASAGVVCWLPDLDRWAAIVSGRLRRGGTFLLYEHHPVWETLCVGEDGVRISTDYFGRDALDAPQLDPTKRPVGWTPQSRFRCFLWPLGDVVTALARAGLRLDLVEEHPCAEMYGGWPSVRWLPATYLVRAFRD
ncbi:MAG: class I SAM-dependent methyltransferase [Actinocatenispora sp.]